VEVEGPAVAVLDALRKLPGVAQVRSPESGTEEAAMNGNATFLVEYTGDDLRKVVSRAVLEHGWGLLEVRSVEPTLEDMYLQLVRDAEKSINDVSGV
jgi:ABC-2 type transport system ATP-binding protein